MKKVLVIILFFLIFKNETFAQEFHVQVEPTSLFINALPPSQPESPLIITNLASSSITLTPLIIPFEPQENGKVTLLLNDETTTRSFIQERLTIVDEEGIVKDLILRPNESKNLKVILDSREGDPPGDYYFSLVFISKGETLEDTSTSSIPSGIATNIMVSIGPKDKGEASITEFSTRSFVSSGPVPFTLKIMNTGDHLLTPRGFITIRNMFGKEVGKLDLDPQYLLKDSSRYLINDTIASPSADLLNDIDSLNLTHPSSIWEEKFLLGGYTAEARITLEEGGEVLTQKITFFALPLQIVIIISGIIFVILGIGLRINYKLNRKSS